MEHEDFADVSWQHDPARQGTGSAIANPRADGEGAGSGSNGKRHGGAGQIGQSQDAMDLAGVGDGVLECTVTSPLKENDGSKDAYVSYLVTTHVSLAILLLSFG